MEINNQYDFFKNILLDSDGSLVVSGSAAIASTNSLSDVLAVGNTTNGNNILINDGDRIENAANPNNVIIIAADGMFISADDTGDGTDYNEMYISATTYYNTITDTTNTSTISQRPTDITIDTVTLLLPNLPTEDPLTINQIYRSGSFLMISNG